MFGKPAPRPRPRKGQRDPVTPLLRLAVFQRDGGCIAPLLDPESGECSGRAQVEHVKTNHRLGKRAESDLAHLVTLCDGHTEPGMRSGRAWNLVAKNRQLVRRYLSEVAA